MLAGDYTKRPQTQGWSQPKLDGIRCIANQSGLWTRAGKEITSCPHIWESVKPFLDANPGVTLDGELYNHELKEDFNKISSSANTCLEKRFEAIFPGCMARIQVECLVKSGMGVDQAPRLRQT